nr:ribosomal-protein-alanine N-acetyltransferase [Legionella jordanis]
MSIKIRSMRHSDIDRVFYIERASHRAPWSRDILSDCVLVGYDCRVLEVGDESSKTIVGYVISRKNLNVCHILNLCVLNTEQKKGYGQTLLKAVLDSLQGSQFDTVILEVRPSNKAALQLYEKFGFHTDLIKRAYYKDENGEEDAMLLKKIISSNSTSQLRGKA